MQGTSPPELSKVRFQTGECVPRSGIYRVSHPEHRLPEEITLAAGDQFPSCAACDALVSFRLLRRVEIDPEFRIHLFLLPVLEDEQQKTSKKVA